MASMGQRAQCRICMRSVFLKPDGEGQLVLQTHDRRSRAERRAARRAGNRDMDECFSGQSWAPADYEYVQEEFTSPVTSRALMSFTGGSLFSPIPPIPSFSVRIFDQSPLWTFSSFRAVCRVVAEEIDVGAIAERLRAKIASQVELVDLEVTLDDRRLQFGVTMRGSKALECADRLDLPDGFCGAIESICHATRERRVEVRATFWYDL